MATGIDQLVDEQKGAEETIQETVAKLIDQVVKNARSKSRSNLYHVNEEEKKATAAATRTTTLPSKIRTSVNQAEWMRWCKRLRVKGMKHENRLLSLRALFNTIDVKGRGWLRPKEVQSSLTKFPQATADLLSEFPIVQDALLPCNLINTMNEMDRDGNARVDMQEWLEWIEKIRLEKVEQERRSKKMYDIFYYVIDTDNSWTVSREEIKYALEENKGTFCRRWW
jgi:hypothetical protein